MALSNSSSAQLRSSALTAVRGATWRNNLRLMRNSASLVSALVIPGMSMLAFWVVFGHAASGSGFDYALFLMAAAMFQAAMFTAGDRRWPWPSTSSRGFWPGFARCRSTS